MDLKCQLMCLNTWFLVGGTVSGLGEAESGDGTFRRWSFVLRFHGFVSLNSGYPQLEHHLFHGVVGEQEQ